MHASEKLQTMNLLFIVSWRMVEKLFSAMHFLSTTSFALAKMTYMLSTNPLLLDGSSFSFKPYVSCSL